MSASLFTAEDRGATLSDDGLYRYDLWRRWDDGPLMGFVMLNPSTADASIDDPTIKRCMGFARRERLAGIVVRNLFAYRTPKPTVLTAAMKRGTDVVGPDNDEWLGELAGNRFGVRVIVAAWGSPGRYAGDRIKLVVDTFAGRLSRIKASNPRVHTASPHPLYLHGQDPIVPYEAH
jgi:hypothetical protein